MNVKIDYRIKLNVVADSLLFTILGYNFSYVILLVLKKECLGGSLPRVSVRKV